MMTMLLVLALAPAGAQDTFPLQVTLQGLYEEISEGVAHATTDAPAAALSATLCTPDWVFIDAAGGRQSWAQARAATARVLRTAPFDTITPVIQQLTVVGDHATVIVTVTIAVEGSDATWRAPDRTSPRDETTTFRDTWVKVGEAWKMQSREQIGQPQVRAETQH
jgi:hypothetical protein